MDFSSIDEMWECTLGLVNRYGKELDSRNGGSREIIGYSARLHTPAACVLQNKLRKFSPTYGAGELFWYLAGTDCGEFITYYAPSYKRFLEPNGKANGAYGKRWAEHGTLHNLLWLLENTPNTRQAVLSMWGPRDLPHACAGDKKDIPCTIALMFFVREEALHCVATMRSNDLWLGFPNDVFTFCQLQCLLADYLNLRPGTYTHNVGSMHLYKKDYDKAEKALNYGYVPMLPSAFAMPHQAFHEDLNTALSAEEAARKELPLWESRCQNAMCDLTHTRMGWLLHQVLNKKGDLFNYDYC